MIKKLLKRIALKIYNIGEFEASQIKKSEKREYYNQQVTFNAELTDIEGSIVLNHQSDKTKISIGDKCIIRGELLIFKHGGKISIGDYCFVGEGTRIWSAKKITIGNRVLIAHNVNIHDNVSHPLNSKLRHEDFKHIVLSGLQSSVDLREADVIVEDDAWIGFNSIILKGVRIGKGAIIGAGSIITKDVPDYAVVVGNEHRILKSVD